MKRSISLLVVAILGFVNAASAAQPLDVKPWVYDPDHLGVSQSSWQPKIGLPDAGKSNHGLLLTKTAPTSANAAAGASINFQGKLTELGFDISNDSWCGAGAPRFNVYTASGRYYFFGCFYGVETPAPDNPTGWKRVRFDLRPFPLGSGFVADSDNNPYVISDFDHVVGIDIVFDEGTEVGPGFALLDNIDLNTILIGKPGAAK